MWTWVVTWNYSVWRRAGVRGLMKNNEIIWSTSIVSLQGLSFSSDRNPWKIPYSGTPSLIFVPGINRKHKGYFTRIFLWKELSFSVWSFRRLCAYTVILSTHISLNPEVIVAPEVLCCEKNPKQTLIIACWKFWQCLYDAPRTDKKSTEGHKGNAGFIED